jgi:hypothetical protein
VFTKKFANAKNHKNANKSCQIALLSSKRAEPQFLIVLIITQGGGICR